MDPNWLRILNVKRFFLPGFPVICLYWNGKKVKGSCPAFAFPCKPLFTNSFGAKTTKMAERKQILKKAVEEKKLHVMFETAKK